MIVRVEGPRGLAKSTVVQAGLEKMGVEYRALRCDVLDVADMDYYLRGPEDVFLLTEVGKMRPDFRRELMHRVHALADKTVWIIGEPGTTLP